MVGFPACITGHMTRGGLHPGGLYPGVGGSASRGGVGGCKGGCIQGKGVLHPGEGESASREGLDPGGLHLGWLDRSLRSAYWGGGSASRGLGRYMRYMRYYGIRSTSGRYASYRNAFLLYFILESK